VTAPRVWLYHAFDRRDPAQDPHNLFVDPDVFDRQLQHLRDSGWTALDLDGWLTWLRGGSAPRRSYLLTIDDGYVSTLEHAAPLLARHGIPAVLFVPPARLGSTSGWMPLMPDEPLLAPDRLRELASYGIEVGAHGLDHTLMQQLEPTELRRHTVEAADAVADMTGRRPRSFAYPEGVHDAAAVQAVRTAGYDTAFSVSGRSVDGSRDRAFAVRRYDVNATDTDRTFRLKATPWWPAATFVAERTPRLRAQVHRLLGSAR
jgi:peptidoglycan/xylan/chitin deacetylase (PgdA/CDA1 family)